MKYDIIYKPIKARRVMLGLTQKSVSSELGVTQSQYSRLENYESNPTKYLKKLSKILKCQPEKLLKSSSKAFCEDELIQPEKSNKVGFIIDPARPERVFLSLNEGWYTTDLIEDLLWLIKRVQSEIISETKPIIRTKTQSSQNQK